MSVILRKYIQHFHYIWLLPSYLTLSFKVFYKNCYFSFLLLFAVVFFQSTHEELLCQYWRWSRILERLTFMLHCDEFKCLCCVSLSKTGLVSSSWERQYFFTQGGNLMQQGRAEVAGGLVTDLDNCSVMAVDCDDRRFCFQVTSFDGKKWEQFFSFSFTGTLLRIFTFKFLVVFINIPCTRSCFSSQNSKKSL